MMNIHIYVHDAAVPQIGETWLLGSTSAYHRSRGLLEAVRVKGIIRDKWGDPAVEGTPLDLDASSRKIVKTESRTIVVRINELWQRL